MNIYVKVGDFRTEGVDAIVFGIFEGETSLDGVPHLADTAMNGAIRELLESGDFEGEFKQTSVLYTRGTIAAPRIGLVGLGKSEAFNLEKARQAAGKIAKSIRDLGAKTFAIPLPSDTPKEMVQAVVEGCLLGLYEFNTHKTQNLDKIKALEAITFIVEDEASIPVVEQAIEVGDTIAGGTILAVT